MRRGRIMAHFQRGRQCPPPLRALLLPVAQRVLHTSVDQIHHGSQDGTLGDPGCRDCNRTHNRHSEILLILKILDVLQDKQQHQRSCESDKDARHSLTSSWMFLQAAKSLMLDTMKSVVPIYALPQT